MKSRLKYWQAFLLFVPAIAGAVVDDLPQASVYDHQTAYAIANCLLALNVCIVIYLQTWYALGFNKRSEKRSGLFKFNAFIPAAFSTLYLLVIIYRSFINPNIHLENHLPGLFHDHDLSITTWIVLGFITHALITFLFINIGFVAGKIKKIRYDVEQAELRARYLKPMKVLRATAIIVFVLTVLAELAIETIKVMS